MKNLFEIDEWKIIQNHFDPSKQLQAESIFSIGNGAFGQRANFEEFYSGETLQGSYLGGIYYPDKTKVGWWKNGYPEYFAKVLNSCNWIGIDFWIDGEKLDLNNQKASHFQKVLDMKNGTLQRTVTLNLENEKKVKLDFTRFCSMDNKSIGIVKATITPLNFNAKLNTNVYLNGKVYNNDANYDELFWDNEHTIADAFKGTVCTSTKKTKFIQSTAMEFSVDKDDNPTAIDPIIKCEPFYVSNEFEINIEQGHSYSVTKFVGISTNLNNANEKTIDKAEAAATYAKKEGFHSLLRSHKKAWNEIWENADVKISGDVAAQQAIRFNIFQLYQTYTGENEKLNIGPKGFTGEKYGGATYWDTEAYCLPFYLKTSHSSVAKQLLKYRYNQLNKAIENAEKLGFKNGAALFPMVTMNGEECHNEWEITFEEIHRNGAIAYAIYNYVEHTGDKEYIVNYGIEVLVAISRFWVQRFNWSENKNAYVILGVTGPNEYENNVNNNWYTNYIAKWCLSYTIQCINEIDSNIIDADEKKLWDKIINNTYLPQINNSNIFLQQDGFLDKEQLNANDINPDERPINQHWSWDRILRSIFIKQADVLQGLYFFEDQFSNEELKENFEFYEPKTVHESSLSPCIHAILATRLNKMDKAYELYLRTSRLDLDDYNHEADEGLHITSMAGTWLAVIEGFAGVKIKNQILHINPKLPNNWDNLNFKIMIKNNPIIIEINSIGFKIKNGNTALKFQHKKDTYSIESEKSTTIHF